WPWPAEQRCVVRPGSPRTLRCAAPLTSNAALCGCGGGWLPRGCPPGARALRCAARFTSNATLCGPAHLERCVVREKGRFCRETQRSARWGPRNSAFEVGAECFLARVEPKLRESRLMAALPAPIPE